MWPDNETTRDFLNFTGIADTVAEIIVQAQGRPISIGVSGAWGAGKSSMIRLTQDALSKRPSTKGQRDFVFVEFNAWLYQGYDDARAALIDVIAEKLEDEAARRKKATAKIKSLVRRVRWLRAAKLVGGTALAVSLGLPPIGLLGELWSAGKRVVAGKADADTLEAADKTVGDTADAASKLVESETSPPKEIHALRSAFVETLDELEIRLVVLIDDLDRCLPETAISTLEAIRLFLFLDHTAFVIAADEQMIRHAVRKHFEGLQSDTLVANYFDKLIQVPIRVPPLGTQEVRAYMMLLYVENSDLEPQAKEHIRSGVIQQLRSSWQGRRVDRAFMQTLHPSMPPDLIARLDSADRLAPIMTSASGIVGNPRLVKRFLNALAIRMTISRAQGVGVDEAVLAKLLLFERLGNPKAYSELVTAASTDDKGRPAFLADWEHKVNSGERLVLDAPWDGTFVTEWLGLPPRLADQDLRGALYVSREHAPLVTLEDRLSSEAADLLAALLTSPEVAHGLKERLSRLSRAETTIIMDRLLDAARKENEWGAPPILEACLTVAAADPPQGVRLAAFLREVPASQVRPSIVPRIGDESWAPALFDGWLRSDVGGPVKAAIMKKRSA